MNADTLNNLSEKIIGCAFRVHNVWSFAVTRQIVQHTKKKRIITKARKDESTKGIVHIEPVEFQ